MKTSPSGSLSVIKANRPRTFKSLNINNLPVYWKANKAAWVTATLFNDWFYNIFVPDVKKHLINKGLAFKVLLVLDYAPGHPLDLQHEKVEVVFLPPNTTSLLQPRDQAIISTLHACWKSLWPDIINGENNSVALEEEYSRIIELGQELGAEGFDDITQADIKELMPDQALNADDLIEMVISCE